MANISTPKCYPPDPTTHIRTKFRSIIKSLGSNCDLTTISSDENTDNFLKQLVEKNAPKPATQQNSTVISKNNDAPVKISQAGTVDICRGINKVISGLVATVPKSNSKTVTGLVAKVPSTPCTNKGSLIALPLATSDSGTRQRYILVRESTPLGYKNPFDYSKYARAMRKSRQVKAASKNEKISEPPSEFQAWYCLLCSRRMDNKESLLDHYEYHKKEKDVAKDQSVEIEVPEEDSPEKQEEPKFSCEICRKSYCDAYTLSIHNTLHSNDPDSYICVVCKQYTSDSTKSLLHHINLNHETKEHACHVCKKVFATLSLLNNHRAVHYKTSTYCTICKKQFVDKHNLTVHKKLFHTASAPTAVKYECRACETVVATETALSKHNCNDDTGLCPVCRRKFKNESTVRRHMPLHGGGKWYMCTECGKSFPTGSALRCHMMVHSGEKPYKCTTCGKRFSQKSALIIHQRGHTGEKPYVCQTCNKGFTSKVLLNKHYGSCK